MVFLLLPQGHLILLRHLLQHRPSHHLSRHLSHHHSLHHSHRPSHQISHQLSVQVAYQVLRVELQTTDAHSYRLLQAVDVLVGINTTVVHQKVVLVATAHQYCYTVLDQPVHNSLGRL